MKLTGGKTPSTISNFVRLCLLINYSISSSDLLPLTPALPPHPLLLKSSSACTVLGLMVFSVIATALHCFPVPPRVGDVLIAFR